MVGKRTTGIGDEKEKEILYEGINLIGAIYRFLALPFKPLNYTGNAGSRNF